MTLPQEGRQLLQPLRGRVCRWRIPNEDHLHNMQHGAFPDMQIYATDGIKLHRLRKTIKKQSETCSEPVHFCSCSWCNQPQSTVRMCSSLAEPQSAHGSHRISISSAIARILRFQARIRSDVQQVRQRACTEASGSSCAAGFPG